MRHDTYYWWNRQDSANPVGPYATEREAQVDALARAKPADDILILKEVSWAGPVMPARDWRTSNV